MKEELGGLPRETERRIKHSRWGILKLIKHPHPLLLSYWYLPVSLTNK